MRFIFRLHLVLLDLNRTTVLHFHVYLLLLVMSPKVLNCRERARSALARLLGGAPAARVRALLGAGSHPGTVFSCLNLQPLTRGATKGVRRARRLRSLLVILRRTRSSFLSVVVWLFVRV